MHHDGRPRLSNNTGTSLASFSLRLSLPPPTSPVLGSAKACASAAHRMRARGCRGEGTERRLEVPSRRSRAMVAGSKRWKGTRSWRRMARGETVELGACLHFDGAECRVQRMMRRNQPNDNPAEARAGTFFQVGADQVDICAGPFHVNRLIAASILPGLASIIRGGRQAQDLGLDQRRFWYRKAETPTAQRTPLLSPLSLDAPSREGLRHRRRRETSSR